MTHEAELPGRAVIAVEGDDRVSFLQGLVTNDVAAAVPGHAVWAALLTPQGKWLADFFVVADGDRLLLDCERGQAEMLAARLIHATVTRGAKRRRAERRRGPVSRSSGLPKPSSTGARPAPRRRAARAGSRRMTGSTWSPAACWAMQSRS